MTTSSNEMSDKELREAIIGIVEAEYKSPNYTPVVERVDHIMHLIKQHREAYALELIGDDEKIPESIFEYGDDDQRKYWYNKLRAELREKVGRDHTK